MKRDDVKAKIVKWTAEEEGKWGKIVIAVPTEKWDSETRSLVPAEDLFECFVGKNVLDKAIAWDKGTERNVSIEIHGEEFKKNNGTEGYSAKCSIFRIEPAKEKENPFDKQKEPATAPAATKRRF